MTQWTPGRRELVAGGAAGLALGALGLARRTRAGGRHRHPGGAHRGARPLHGDPFGGRRPRRARQPRRPATSTGGRATKQSHSTIKVLILVTTLKVAQDRGRALTSTQRSLASRMIRYSDNDATDALMTQVGVGGASSVADQLGMTRTTVLGGTVFRSARGGGTPPRTTRDLVRLMNRWSSAPT